MNRNLMLAFGLSLGLATTPGIATAGTLKGELTQLEEWLGVWVFDGQWSNGSTLWSQSIYRPLLGGKFLEGLVFVRDGGGATYQRYRTIFAWDAGQQVIIMHTFSHDGSYTKSTMKIADNVATTAWKMGETSISERMEVVGDQMSWKVWAETPESVKSQIMDGIWHRSEDKALSTTAPGIDAHGPLPLETLLGGWEINDRWSDGRPLWARNEYRIGLNGLFIDATTWTKNDDGEISELYNNVFAGTPEGGQLISFAHDGGISESRWIPIEDGQIPTILLNGGPSGAAEFEQDIKIPTAGEYQWSVRTRTNENPAWQKLIDGTWLRQGPAKMTIREPIDPSRFAASGKGIRSFAKERIFAAPASDIYALWTHSEAWARLWGPPASSSFDLAIGGAYEWRFDGIIGSNGCQVLSYIPDHMVSFSWNAPPDQPASRLARTWVVVELEAIDNNNTRVRLTHLGFGDGEQWDETFNYFENAWDRVLDLMVTTLTQ